MLISRLSDEDLYAGVSELITSVSRDTRDRDLKEREIVPYRDRLELMHTALGKTLELWHHASVRGGRLPGERELGG